MISLTPHQLAILAVLAHDPDGEIHFRELARRLGREAGVIQKSLNSLEEQGFVESRRRGNQRLIRLNSGHPLAGEVRSIVEKSAGIAQAMRAALAKLSGVRIAFIFGSYAKGGYALRSDIDVVIVGDAAAEPALLKAVAAIEKKFGREINYKWYCAREFGRRRAAGDPFLEEVLGERHIMLKGRLCSAMDICPPTAHSTRPSSN